jgi:hypothetical protein
MENSVKVKCFEERTNHRHIVFVYRETQSHKVHRDNGPAKIFQSGKLEYYYFGKLTRVCLPNGDEFFYNGRSCCHKKIVYGVTYYRPIYGGDKWLTEEEYNKTPNPVANWVTMGKYHREAKAEPAKEIVS